MDRPIALDASLLTGDAAVDEQHYELVALANRVAAAESEGRGVAEISSALEELAAYAASHFGSEERLMRSSAYPEEAAEAHRAEHRDLTKRTRDFVMSYRRGEMTSVRPILEFLGEWLSEHLANTDRKLVDHVRATSGGEPEV
jgi:hemerythrin-like metal-binding protein